MSGRIVIGSLALLLSWGLSPVSAQGPLGYQGGSQHPYGQYQPYTPQQIPGGYQPNGVDFDSIPDDTGWLYPDTPLEQAIKGTFRHAFFRLEYLLWDITDPGQNVLGGPTNTGVDPREVAIGLDPLTGAAVNIFSPTTDGFKTNDNNGIRATLGIELASGTLEANVWALDSTTNSLDGNTLTDTTTNLASYLLTAGQPQGAFLLYSQDYLAELKTSVWGTEANYVMGSTSPNEPFQIRPLAGFRYISFDETLNQSGLYDAQDDLGNVISLRRQIDTAVRNNVYGPQIGLRAELISQRFVLGVEPKIALGVNTVKSTLRTQQVLGAADPSLFLTDTETTFGPVADLNVYSRVNFTENLSLLVSYNLTWIGGLSRPDGNVVYDSLTSPATRSNLSQDIHFTDAILSGLSVGGEFKY